MTALATNHDFLVTTNTSVGGVSFAGGNPWASKGTHEVDEPTRNSLSDPEQLWLRIVMQEIRAIAALRDDWDTFEAGPIRRDVLWYALRLLQSVMEDFPPPQLTPMSHEGLLLEWHRNGIHLEIEIENAGVAHVAYGNEQSGIDHSWEVKANFASLSEPLRAIAEQSAGPSTIAS